MSEPTFIDNLFAIQQAIRDGKEWEYCGQNGVWFRPLDQSIGSLNGFAETKFKVRLKPEPPKPRWWSKPSDVPGPVCWMRHSNGRIAMIVEYDIEGVALGVMDEVVSWDMIAGKTGQPPWEYSTDRITWKPCCTTEDQP